MSDSLMTIQESADFLKVHWQTIRTYIKQGKIPATKIGRNIRIRESDVRRFAAGIQKPKEVEIELRYRCTSRNELEKKLLDKGARIVYHSHIIDHYFAQKDKNSIKEQNEFYESGRGFGLRIREQDNDYSGVVTSSLEVKRLTEALDHNTCIESEILVPDYESVRDLLSLMNMNEYLVIDKERVMYRYKNTKVCIDEIKDYGSGVEIEIKSDRDRDEVIEEISAIATELGLTDKDIIKTSMTHEAMQKLARF